MLRDKKNCGINEVHILPAEFEGVFAMPHDRLSQLNGILILILVVARTHRHLSQIHKPFTSGGHDRAWI